MDTTQISVKELVVAVCRLGENGGGVVEITGTWKGKPRTIWIEQIEWHETPVCLIGGNGQEVSAAHPRDVAFALDCILGNYLDGETVSMKIENNKS